MIEVKKRSRFDWLKAKLPTGRHRTVLVTILFIALAGAAGYFGWQFFTFKNNPQEQAAKANQEVADRIKTQINAFYAAPDETPTVARVENKDSLAGQVFFEKAQNGDYVIIYEKAKFALLYREQDKKLINAGPVNTTSDSANTAATPASQPAAPTATDKSAPVKTPAKQ